MKPFVHAKSIFCAVVAAAALGITPASAQEEIDYVLGQWEFDGDLSAATGEPIEYFGAISNSTEFVTQTINGEEAEVMQFPKAAPGEGYKVFHGAEGNGGGTNVNNYTLIMDIMYPAGSDGTWRALLKTREDNFDADIFISNFGGIGINAQYDGTILADTWYRVALAFGFDTNGTYMLEKYVDGQLVGSQNMGASVDGRWSLEPSFLLFADNNNETELGYINSLQFRDYTMTAEEIAELGLPSAAGITSPGVPPAGDFSLSIEKSGNNVIITVDESGTYHLERADTVNGTYVDVGTSSNGTFTVPIGSSPAFFRAHR